jgi:hypothetical protein
MKESENDYLNNKSPKISGGKPYIICAAIWFKDGKKYSHQPRNVESGFVAFGRRHYNCYLSMSPDGDFSKMNFSDNEQGFLTSDDRFLDRKESGLLAFEVGQIDKLTECLFSEDLY